MNGGWSLSRTGVQKYVSKNPAEFSGKTLEFEVNVISGRVDLRVDNILYEFKSVSSVPPADFAKQMARDLTNANSLDEIKWLFDGQPGKLPNGISQVDKDAMLSALDEMSLSQSTIDKFVPDGNIGDVVDQIELKFSQIFQV
ncbi:hypothetical protein DSECCO2_472730 [anaerobic digester metagenome]